jgi:hypothetical protein
LCFFIEGVPFLVAKYREQLEKEVEVKQQYAEEVERRKAAKLELIK